MSAFSTTRTFTTSGAQVAIPIDLKRFRYGVGIFVTIPAGSSATYTVEVTGDEITGEAGPQAVPPVPLGLVNWNKHDILQNKTASANSNLAYPATAVRLNIAALSGSIAISVTQPNG